MRGSVSYPPLQSTRSTRPRSASRGSALFHAFCFDVSGGPGSALRLALTRVVALGSVRDEQHVAMNPLASAARSRIHDSKPFR